MSRIGVLSLFLLGVLWGNGYPEWQAVGPWGGAARVIRLDEAKPDTMLAVAMRGTAVFRSRDGAKNWTMLKSFPELPNTRLDCAWMLPGKWLVGAAPGGLYSSTDEGEHWAVVPGTEKLSVYAITSWKKDARVLAIGTNAGVWMSNDGAATWRRVSPKTIDDLTAIVSVAFDPEKAGTLYAGTPHLPWKTTNGGTTWQKAHVGMFDDSDIFSIVVDSRKPGRMFASACSGIYCSLNSGAAWRRVQGIPGTNRRTYVVAQSPHQGELLFAGTSAGMWTSRNGGETWKKLNEMVATSIAFHPLMKEVFFISTERHGLQKTSDNGTTFEPVHEGFVSRTIEALEAEDGVVRVLSQYDGSYAKAGDHWESVRYQAPRNGRPDGDAYELAVSPFEPEVQLRASNRGLEKSVDGGKSWKVVQKDWIRSVAFDPKQKGLCFALRHQRVFWSPDSGENWYWMPANEDSQLSFSRLFVFERLYAVSPSRGVYVQEIPKSFRMN